MHLTYRNDLQNQKVLKCKLKQTKLKFNFLNDLSEELNCFDNVKNERRKTVMKKNNVIIAISAIAPTKSITALMTFTLVVLLGMAGCKDSGTSGNHHRQPSFGVAGAPYDLQFIDTMVVHHQGAIDMAKMAESKALQAELKGFAKKSVVDQEREIDQMRQWREQWYAKKPKAENMELLGMRDSMKGMDMAHMMTRKGADFDRMFLDMMIPHHLGAVTMAKDAMSKSEHPEIKTLAQQIIDAQQKEIEMMNKWKAEWSGAK